MPPSSARPRGSPETSLPLGVAPAAAEITSRPMTARFTAVVLTVLSLATPIPGPSIVDRLHHAGGHVVAGSDTSNPYVIPGASLHRELELLVDAGLFPRDALASATRTAAAFLGQTGTLGTLGVGKIADLVVLGADPSVSLAALRQVRLVGRDGRIVWRPS